MTQEWKKFSYSAPSAGAHERAVEIVRKLAPEVTADAQYLYSAEIRAQNGNIVNRKCCWHTFDEDVDRHIPMMEKNVTLYLWAKLFPERFANRKSYRVWPIDLE